MSITYYNTRTGVGASMPEPNDYPNRETDERERRAAVNAGRTLEKMDLSKRWVREGDMRSYDSDVAKIARPKVIKQDAHTNDLVIVNEEDAGPGLYVDTRSSDAGEPDPFDTPEESTSPPRRAAKSAGSRSSKSSGTSAET